MIALRLAGCRSSWVNAAPIPAGESSANMLDSKINKIVFGLGRRVSSASDSHNRARAEARAPAPRTISACPSPSSSSSTSFLPSTNPPESHQPSVFDHRPRRQSFPTLRSLQADHPFRSRKPERYSLSQRDPVSRCNIGLRLPVNLVTSALSLASCSLNQLLRYVDELDNTFIA
nr:hypothetical protein CFP56_64110 [Quercus suber]